MDIRKTELSLAIGGHGLCLFVCCRESGNELSGMFCEIIVQCGIEYFHGLSEMEEFSESMRLSSQRTDNETDFHDPTETQYCHLSSGQKRRD